MTMKKRRIFYGGLFLALLLTEILIALFVRDRFVRPYLGDVLVTVLLCCLVRIFLPRRLPALPLYVFAFAAAVEVAQYFDVVALLGLQDSVFFSTLMGRSFSWWDIVCYAVGCAAVFLAERLLGRRRPPLSLSLQDGEWPFTYTDHDREIVRAIVVDGDGYYYFNRLTRDDVFCRGTVIETAGGGVEAGEELPAALRRELAEELGAEVEILAELGTVSDYYNLIHRHNINRYYLCRATAFGDTAMTEAEMNAFHLTTLKLTYEQAVAEYERCREHALGRLIAARELPVLQRAREWMARQE